MKICTNELGHMTNMAAMLWVDLDPFYTKVKFGEK